MNIGIVMLMLLGGYLLGSVSFARIVGRWVVPEEDLTNTKIAITGTDAHFETTSVSATALSGRVGPKYGCLVSIFDMLKTGVPVFLAAFYFPAVPAYALAVGIGGVLGHNYPLYHQFKGGRGLSPIMGAYFAIDWLSLVIALVVSSLLGFVVLKRIGIGYSGWLFLLIPAMWVRFQDPLYVLFAVVVAALFMYASRIEGQQFKKMREDGVFEGASMELEGFEKWDILKRFRR